MLLPPRSRGRPPKTERPQRFTQREQHPINHHVAGRGANPRSWTEISLGARAYPTNLNNLKPLGRLDKDRPAQISHIVKYSRGTATHVHGPEPCKLGTPERAVDDRHEVDITPARAKRSHTRRADDVEALDAIGNDAIQSTKEIVNSTSGQLGQHGTSVPTLADRLPEMTRHVSPAACSVTEQARHPAQRGTVPGTPRRSSWRDSRCGRTA